MPDSSYSDGTYLPEHRYSASLPSAPAFPGTMLTGVAAETGWEAPRPDAAKLVKKYLWLALLFVIVGGAGGFFSVALLSPIYSGRALLEIQSSTDVPFRKGGDSESADLQTNIQTQIQLIKTNAFMRGVMDRVQSEIIPSAPAYNDVYARLRRRLRTNTQDPLALMKEGLGMALETFQARPINGTRLIEISCDSTNPEIAASFLNTLANEFIEQNMQAHAQGSQRTGQWLSGQLEETKSRLQESEQRLQDFVKSSGNLFVAQENTLADSKLRELQAQLSGIQADRIAKQARFEMVSKSPPEALPDVLDDGTLRSYQAKIADLRRELASLETTLEPGNPKIKKIQAQITELQATLKDEVAAVIERIRNDYDAALRKENLLSGAYSAQAGQVSSQASKAAQYEELRRELDLVRQTYNAMLLQANETGIASSLPMENIRLVDPSTPAAAPYKPRPVLNIGFGNLAGLFLAAGIVFIREKRDQSVKAPGSVRSLLNVPELGVIPSLPASKPRRRLLPAVFKRKRDPKLEGDVLPAQARGGRLELPAWQQNSLLAESFRLTLASVMRDAEGSPRPRVILVTSPGAEEGKTMVASNLAVALAEAGAKVVLLDADFRRPRLHSIFDLPNATGLGDLLKQETPITACPSDLPSPTAIPGLYVLPNGSKVDNIAKAIYSPRLRELLWHLKTQFDTILIDVPPMIVADARVIAELADGTVLVLRSGVTDRRRVLDVYRQLQQDGVPVLGAVLNDWKPSKAEMRKQYYPYQT